MSKILYAADSMEHIRNFHLPYVEKLKSDGHDVTVMAKGKDADINVDFTSKKLSSKNAVSQGKLRKIIGEAEFDTVIINGSTAALRIRRALSKRKRPTVINIVHGYPFFKDTKNARERMALSSEKSLSSKTDYIVVMNSEDYAIATENKLCLCEVRVIRGMGAVVGGELLPPDTIYHFTYSQEKFVICFVGEICRDKNQRMLICALPEIQLEIPNAVLWLIGEGGTRHELIELADELNISDSVCFMGERRNPCDYMRACHLYVSASEREGSSISVAEALGCGKTVLATDIKGHRDIIEHGVSGYLFPAGNMSALISLVKDFHNGKIGIEPGVARARFEEFSRDSVFTCTYNAIAELVKKR